MSILEVTDNADVVETVRSAAILLRKRKTVESSALAVILEHAADEMSDDNVLEVFDAELVRDKLYVTSGSVVRKYGDSSLWTATLALARMIVMADG